MRRCCAGSDISRFTLGAVAALNRKGNVAMSLTINPNLYIQANTDTAASIAIADLIWCGTPFRESLEQITNHVRKYQLCSTKEFEDAIFSTLKTCANKAGFTKFCKERMTRYTYHSTKEYILGEYLTNKTAKQIAEIIRAELAKENITQ